jgi:hypothetical protein
MPESAAKTEEPKAASKTEELKTIKLPTAVLGFDLEPDGKALYAACLDGGVYQVDPESGESVLLGRHDSYASGLARVPHGSTLISAGYDGVLQWHDLNERKTVRKVNAHRFWSWQMAVSPDGQWAASATGQYLCGGYKYEPAPENEPSVKVFDAATGELAHSFSHLPPVLSIAFSPDNRYIAAGNLMGDIRVWDLTDGKLLASWNTPAFTSWGIIKCHYYIGGIYALAFTPDSAELIAGGMGPMRDPMAGNGKQTWQRFAWREDPPRKVDEIHDGDHGGGHPESLAFHPSRAHFVMAGRLAQGKWNTGFFDAKTGALVHSLDAKGRLTKAAFNGTGDRMYLAGTVGQEKKKDGQFPEFGRIKIYRVNLT